MFDQFFLRIKNKCIRILRSYGLFLPARQFLKNTNSQKNFKLLIVAPGMLAIPPKGWGAVEHIISETVEIFEQNGFEVWILNSNHKKEWIEARKFEYDVILNHSDQDCLKIRKFWPKTPLVTVSHYGFGAFEEAWNKDFKKILMQMDVSNTIVCLSKEVQKTFSKHLVNAKLIVSPNGSSFTPKVGRDSNAPLVCVGKIEKRKFQYELWSALRNTSLEVVFIGPIVDSRIKKLTKTNKANKKYFIGAKDREYLSENFQNFSGLILPSLGEADALVLYEAQLAGLPIFVSERGLGSQNRNLDWVEVIPQQIDVSKIEKILSKYNIPADTVSAYARYHYSWEVRSKPLLKELLSQVISD
jgi:Glycosyl transferases group 1